MGVEYRHLIVPADRMVRPDVATLDVLIKRLTVENFLPKGPFIIAGGDDDGEEKTKLPRSFASETVSATWAVDTDDGPARYPFVADGTDVGFWTFELHLGAGLLCYSGELVGETNLACLGCGADLGAMADEHPMYFELLVGVPLACPSCERPVIPAEHRCELNLAALELGGDAEILEGGGLFRCGLFIDTGKELPQPNTLDPTLHALLVEAFGPLVVFPDVH